MATKMLRIAQTNFIQLKFDDGKEIFAHVTPEVKSYALQNLKPGDEVDVISSKEVDGLHVTKIGKVGTLGTQATPSNNPTTVSEATQSQKTQVHEEYRGQYRVPMNPAEARTVRRQAVMGYACQVSQAVVCQHSDLSAKGVSDYVISVFRLLLAEVEAPETK